ncbi:glycosyltransferase family 4 protein [Alicyclobacillus tolerans]|uniref:glycosyltransferase family 4 protein n=1 Tax=Alicyclobacillus tolerans TaxID=90970 RepID=UPI001F39993A|nr:glycosyltransferase family 1 protein [Alicyclobacillus tolerans]MCF8567685.1 glycosyltransferase family 4 protein [Alicyclobacillus tolerans]
MKIAVDVRMARNTGIGRYISNLVDGLSLCPDITPLVLLQNSESPFKVMQGHLQHVELKSRIFTIREQFELRNVLKKTNPNVVHSPQFNAPVATDLPLVVTIHDLAYDRFPEEFPSYKAFLYYRAMMKWVTKKARSIITVSNSSKVDLMNYYRVPESKIHVIYHGNPALRSGGNDLYVNSDTGSDTRYFLYVGMNRPRKNLRRLIDAFEATVDRTNHLLLTVGTESTDYYDIRGDVERRGLEDKVKFLGRLSDQRLMKIYEGATAVVFPSIYEGFGFPVLEAMSRGVPVVCSNTSSLPEIVGEAALTFNPYNTNDMAEALLEISSNQQLRSTLSLSGLNRVPMFDWTRSIAEHIAVYESVI